MQDANQDRGGLDAVQERLHGHGACIDHEDQHVPDPLRLGTHDAIHGAVISAGIHPFLA